MNKEAWKGVLLLVICCFAVFVVSYSCGSQSATKSMEKQAIDRDIGYYHPKTKKFTWREDDGK